MTGPAFADTPLLDTASATVPAGTESSGWDLDTQVLGASFTTSQPYTVTSLGFNGGINSGTLFFALVPADPATFLPTSPNLSNAIYSNVFTGLAPNTDISFATDIPLAAGTYDVEAGSGLFGASGRGFLTQYETVNESPTFIQAGPGLPFFVASSFTGRFFVNGVTPTTPAVPEPSSFALIGLALPALGMMARRRVRK